MLKKIKFSEMFPILPTKIFVSHCVYTQIIFLFLAVIYVVDCTAFPAFLLCTLLCKVSWTLRMFPIPTAADQPLLGAERQSRVCNGTPVLVV